MDGILFIAMFASLGLVAWWYVGNEARGEKGGWGLLSLRDETKGPAAPVSRYVIKDRIEVERSRPTFDRPETDDQAGSRPRYRETGRGKFRDKDDKAYRSRGPLPVLGERKPRASGDQ